MESVAGSPWCAQAYAQAPPCDGSYEMINGHSTWDSPKPSSVVADFNNRTGLIGTVPMNLRAEGMHEIEVSQCGRQVVLSGNFNMVLHQSALDETEYVGQDSNLGLETIISVDDHKNMIGKFVFSVRGGHTAQFPFTLEPRDTSMPDLEGCSDDVEAESETFALENAAARAFLAARGMTPPSDFAPGDYFRAVETEHDVASDSRRGSTRRIRLLLGRNNAILPVVGMREICRAGSNKLDPPRRMLNFKIYPVKNPDGYKVFAQEIDIETGKIVVQAEGESTGRNASALQQGMMEAASGLEANGTDIGPLSNGLAP